MQDFVHQPFREMLLVRLAPAVLSAQRGNLLRCSAHSTHPDPISLEVVQGFVEQEFLSRRTCAEQPRPGQRGAEVHCVPMRALQVELQVKVLGFEKNGRMQSCTSGSSDMGC